MSRLLLPCALVAGGLALSACSADGGSDATADGTTDATATTASTRDLDIDALCAQPDVSTPQPPADNVQNTTFEGFQVFYSAPTPVRGWVVFFHGTGGSASDALDTEQSTLFRMMAGAGWGWVATESADRDPGGQWDEDPDRADNVDMPRVARLVDWLNAEVGSSDATPLIPMGFSQGGSGAATFVDLYADDRPIVALSSHNSSAGGGVFPVPSVWVSAENDDTASPAKMGERYDDQRAGGQEALWIQGQEQVTRAEMFQRNDNITAEEAPAFFDDLVAVGLIDADGNRVLQGDHDTLDGALTGWGRTSAVPGAARVGNLMHAIWSLHKFSGYDAGAECAFLLSVNAP